MSLSLYGSASVSPTSRMSTNCFLFSFFTTEQDSRVFPSQSSFVEATCLPVPGAIGRVVQLDNRLRGS